MKHPRNWLQGAVIYQIYPRSFYDAKGTGIGNLQGIIDKLDYLGGKPDSLGVSAIWISPIYTSPMADFGYDVADYTGVDPIFGSLQDVEKLIVEAHKRSIRVILDFVPNHTSDEHAWFVESRSSRDNPKRDWYTWDDPKTDGGPPNNWLSVFGGSAWQLDETTGQYYLHSFLAKQPDLNWDNPEVREAMKSAMRFWLDRGIDGFRVDAVDWLSKDADMRDDPVNGFAIDKADHDHDSLRHIYSRDGPQLFERLNEMADVLSAYPERFMITEAHPETDDKIAGYLKYYQSVNPSLSAPFNFQGIYLPWEVQPFREFINNFQAGMRPGYTPIYTTGNHDESRIASRIGPAAARTAAVMLLTLPGMAFIYYGEEIGMADVPIPDDRLRDPFVGIRNGRDPERTPMQWDATPNAGFSAVEPWLPVAEDYRTVNVAAEASDADSSLSLYKRLIQLRTQSDTLTHGTYESLDLSPSILCYKRAIEDDTVLVLLNFTTQPQRVQHSILKGRILLSTHPDNHGADVTERVELSPNEGLVIELIRD